MMEMQTVTVDPATAGSIVRPKLQDIEAQIDPEEDEKTRKNKEMKRTLATRIIQGSAVACMVLNLVAMIIEWSGIMATAGIVGIGVAGGVVYFQNELRNEDTLRQVQNQLRHHVNDLAEENNKLSSNVTRLEGKLAPLKETETKLKTIADKNGVTVDKLRGLLKTNQQTLNKMRENLEADVMVSMIDIVLQADRTEDGIFSERELQGLVLRLKMNRNIEMNEELFKEEVAKLQTEKQQYSSILKLMEQIHEDDIPEDERVFKLSAQALETIRVN
jgi:uncharacterized protein YdbL (DUF1318 family)